MKPENKTQTDPRTKCDKCLKSRMIISENGYHGICTLPPKAATDCITGNKDRFLGLDGLKGGSYGST
jgi:hypothetical protein